MCKSLAEYTVVTGVLVAEYNESITEFENSDITHKFAFQLQLVQVYEAPKELQIEWIKLSEDDDLKILFDAKKDQNEI